MSSKSRSEFREPAFIKRLVSREPEAVKAVVTAYTEHLYKAGLGMGLRKEMAEDVAHETWATFFEVVPRFEGRSHIRTFIFGIFYNKCAEHRRSNMKFEKTDPIDEIMESQFRDDGHWKDSTVDPHLFSENAEMMKILEKCLEGLPDQQRAAFILKIVEEGDTEEICETLNISHTNFRQLLFRGKNRLKECISRSIK